MCIKKGESEKLLRVIEDENLSTPEAVYLLGRKLIKIKELKLVDKIILTVDYSRTLQEMIVAGKYDWKDSNVTEKNFPKVSGDKNVFCKLFHFNRSISSKEAIAEMDKTGYRPATLFELLALGAKYPGLQHQFPIVALDSVLTGVDGDRRVPPCLRVCGWRELGLVWSDRDWSDDYRFLAVRN